MPKININTIWLLVWLCIAVFCLGWVVRSLLIPDNISDAEWLNYRLQECQYRVEQLEKPINFYDMHKSQHFASIIYPNIETLLYRIVECESGWRADVCNKEYGCGSGMGLCQFVPSTWKWAIEEMGLNVNELDIFNPEDNLKVCRWLLISSGSHHWEQSRHCWENYEIN